MFENGSLLNIVRVHYSVPNPTTRGEEPLELCDRRATSKKSWVALNGWDGMGWKLGPTVCASAS